MARHLSALVLLVVAAFLTISYLMSPFGSTPRPMMGAAVGNAHAPGAIKAELSGISDDLLHGGSIAPKLENATAKYVQAPGFRSGKTY